MKTKIVILAVLTLFLLGGVKNVGLAKQRKEAVKEGHTWGEEKPTGNYAANRGRVISENLIVRVNLVGLPVFVWTKVPQVPVTPDKIVNQRNHSAEGGTSNSFSK